METYSPLFLINVIKIYLYSYSLLECTKISHLVFPVSPRDFVAMMANILLYRGGSKDSGCCNVLPKVRVGKYQRQDFTPSLLCPQQDMEAI